MVLQLCLQSVVQVETLGEVGVFFTLFLVGLEFSPERLRKVRASPGSVVAPNLVSYGLSLFTFSVFT